MVKLRLFCWWCCVCWSQITGLTAYIGTQLFHTLTLLSADVGKFLCWYLFTASTSVEPSCVPKSARFMWISSIFPETVPPFFLSFNFLSQKMFYYFLYCPGFVPETVPPPLCHPGFVPETVPHLCHLGFVPGTVPPPICHPGFVPETVPHLCHLGFPP